MGTEEEEEVEVMIEVEEEEITIIMMSVMKMNSQIDLEEDLIETIEIEEVSEEKEELIEEE